MPLDDGEYTCLLNKIDKLEDVIIEMKAMMCSVLAVVHNQTSVRSTPATDNHASAHFNTSMHDTQMWPPISRPTVEPSLKSTRPPRAAQSADQPEKSLRKQPAKKPSVIHNVHFATATQRSDAKATWSDRVEAEENVGDYMSSASSDHRDADDDEFEIHLSPKRKKQRKRSELMENAAASVSAAGGSKQLIGNPRSGNNLLASGVQSGVQSVNVAKKKASSKPLLVGRKSSTLVSSSPTITAARTFKSVYIVDNLSKTCDMETLMTFLKKLKVRTLTCFEVKPRMTRWQRAHDFIPDHRAYRICINKADNDRLLDESKWPADITLSLIHI